MPSNYTGNPIATQDPSPAPSLGSTTETDPIGSLPVNGDPPDGSAFEQAYKVPLDWIAFFRRHLEPTSGIQASGVALSTGTLGTMQSLQFPGGTHKILTIPITGITQTGYFTWKTVVTLSGGAAMTTSTFCAQVTPTGYQGTAGTNIALASAAITGDNEITVELRGEETPEVGEEASCYLTVTGY
jgi:hypothetical protein